MRPTTRIGTRSARPHAKRRGWRATAAFPLVVFGLVLAGDAHARGLPKSQVELGAGSDRAAAQRAVAGSDTVYFGGTDPVTGLAVEGGIWDFELEPGETDPLEGWTSRDLSTMPTWVRRVTSIDFAGDLVDGTITEGGSTASLWWGVHDAEADQMGWPGGVGYGNDWNQNASKSFTYAGGPGVELSFDYFVDTETSFDFVYVYVVDDQGVRSPPLNTSAFGGRADGRGYSGSNIEALAIGSPANPAHDTIAVDAMHLPGVAGETFEVLVQFDSDPIFSDQDGNTSTFGAFGLDDVRVLGMGQDDLSTFENGVDGWSLFAAPGVGNLLAARALGELDPVDGSVCSCPIGGNVLVMADVSGAGPAHPDGQREHAISPTIPISIAHKLFTTRIVTYDAYLDLPRSDAVGFRVAMHYYPWTNPQTLQQQWTVEPADPSGSFSFASNPLCGTFAADRSTSIPLQADSLKIVIELLSSCTDFGATDCTGPEETNDSPYVDHVRLCLTGLATGPGAPAPAISEGLLYQDAFPLANSLHVGEPADVGSYWDFNRGDLDESNADRGDSATVHTSLDPLVETYLNFRVYPGPFTNTSDPFFSKYGGTFQMPGGSWAKARMDTAEAFGGAAAGVFATYDFPDGLENGAEIIPDGVLTPGATVEYFFSTNTTGSTNQRFLPDTTGGVYHEFEILPGAYRNPADASECLAPCLLYVDAAAVDAQTRIEGVGLGPFLGSTTDPDGVVHQNWDRYDYQKVGANFSVSLAREAAGDNGMTVLQSHQYRTIFYNSGENPFTAIRDGDAQLLESWLTNDQFGNPALGLWLSGNGVVTSLARPFNPNGNRLLSLVGAAALSCDAYRDCANGNAGDPTLCVRLDPSGGADFPSSPVSYASVRGNGCPIQANFDVLATTGSGVGNLDYVDQDAIGEPTTLHASVSNDRLSPGSEDNYRMVIDGFSLHHLRSTPPGFSGIDCGNDDAAIGQRAADVLSFLGTPLGACGAERGIVEVGPGAPAAAPAVTRLHAASPNPFNPQTTLRYDVARKGVVRLELFDVTGRMIRTLVDTVQEPASYAVRWEGMDGAGREAGSGVYWARLSTSGGFSHAVKLVVLK